MKTFTTYTEAQAWAQAEANRTGLSLGIEAPDGPLRREWLVRFLPGPGHRYGYDLACEAVEPERYASGRPGVDIAKVRASYGWKS
jgi:hypothetical protein